MSSEQLEEVILQDSTPLAKANTPKTPASTGSSCFEDLDSLEASEENYAGEDPAESICSEKITPSKRLFSKKII